jgi:hypothetical protein
MLSLLWMTAAFAGSVVLDFSEPAAARAPLRVGVIAGPTGTPDMPDLTKRFQEFGIRYIRNNDYYDDRLDMEGIFNCGGATYPSWDGCDPKDPKNYNWSPSDAMMKVYKDGGFEPMLRLGGEWQNKGRNHDFKGPQTPTQEQNWIVAATAVAKRYRHQYTYLNIWTEFPGKQFWDRKETEFAPFWSAAYKAVKEAAPEARVGGPGFAMMAVKEVQRGQSHGTAEAFLRQLYRDRVRPDWIGWHMFSNDPQDLLTTGRLFRDLLEGSGQFSGVPWASDRFFSGVELVLDALGTSVRDGREKMERAEAQDLHRGPRGGAIIGAHLVALQATDTTRAYIYRASDPAPQRGKQAQSWLGLFAGDQAGTPKKRAHAVRLWAAFTSEYPTITALSVPTGDGPWAALATGTKGSAVFVANVTNAPISLRSKGTVKLESATGATAWVLDDTQEAAAAFPLPTGPVTLPALGVMLIEIPRK